MILRKRIASSVMAGLLIVSLVLPTNANELSEAEQRAKQLEEQRRNAQSEMTSLEEKLKAIVADMNELDRKMTEKESEIETAEEEIIAAKVEENKQYEKMKKRIQYMYEHGDTGFLEVLLEAKDIADLLKRTEYVSKVSKSDRDMLDKFRKLVKDVEQKEQNLKEEYGELGILQADLTQKQTEVETILSEKTLELAGIESEIGEVQILITKAKEAERRRKEAEEAARRKEEENAQKPSGGNTSGGSGNSVVSGNGYFTHPCPGMTYQSSYFGEIRQGIGDTRPHKGHDYAAPQGTPIYAAAAGRVLVAGYSNSAGYWVVIDHGNGLVSKYMHMYTMPYVSAGQTVSKGQNIGGVGSTGQSTGNHLHFQVELNQVPVNPSNYM